MRASLLFFLLLAAPLLMRAAHALAADAARGEQLYEYCQECHALDKNEVGPRHRGVFGRKAGSVPDYAYSQALRDSGFTWNEATLQAWLADPQLLVPGSKMFFHLEQEQDRADVIEFLKTKAR